jgi:hypothetical protein
MNYRVSTPATAKGRRAWLFLSLLLPALASKVTTPNATVPSQSGDGRNSKSLPYLRFIGPPPLRFQDALPPPDLSVRPPPGAPPKLEEKAARYQQAENADAAKSAPVVAATTEPAPVLKPVAVSEQADGPAPAPSAAPVQPILPDDVQSKVKPEDFLPFFQYPGAGSGEPPVPPAPGTLPPSTATYKQQ